MSRINAYRDAVVAVIKSRLPDLRSCEAQFGRFDLDALETDSFSAPAVRVSVLRARSIVVATGEADAALECAAFVVTDGRGRDERAWTIGEAISVLLEPAQLWGINRMSGPSDVSISPLASTAMNKRGIALLAVEWKQELRGLGEGIWDEKNHLITDLYLNDEEVEADE